LFGFELGFNNLEAKWNFLYFSIAVAVLYVLKAFATFGLQMSINFFAENRRCELLVELTRSYLSQPYSFHLRQSTVELFNRAYMGSTNYSSGILNASLRALNDLVVMTAIIIYLVFQSPWAVLLLGLTLLFVFLASHGYIRRHQSAAMSTYLAANGRVWAMMLQSLQAVKELKILGREFYFIDRMREDSPKIAESVALVGAFSVLPRVIIEGAVVVFLVGYCWFLMQFVDGPELVGSLGLLAVASVRLMPAASSLMGGLNTMRAYRPQLSMVCEELRRATISLDFSEPSDSPPAAFEMLQLEQLSFRYSAERDWIFRDLDFTIKRGDSIGFMGRSGAGKSTLADLILGLFRPDSGRILMDGVDIHTDIAKWQQQVAYIPQAVFILDDTLLRNVALGVPDEKTDLQRVWRALEQAQLAETVRAMPEQLSTQLGERGLRLSGGQRQRIAIARALYHNREVLILDEATSALDQETEQAVVEAMGALRGQKTLIVIAHKASILRNLAQIYTVEDGALRAGAPSYAGDDDLREPRETDAGRQDVGREEPQHGAPSTHADHPQGSLVPGLPGALHGQRSPQEVDRG